MALARHALLGATSVISPGPGRIIADERIALPRPRDPTGVGFDALRRHLSGLLAGLH